MKAKSLKIVVFALILTFYGSLLVHKINLPAADDLPRQIKIGETILHGNFEILYKNVYSYTEPEQNFYNHHWLSGVVFYLLYHAVGWNGLVVFKIIILLAAFALLFLAATRKADFWLVAFFSLPTIIILRERTGLRPEVFSYLFIAVYLYFLIDLDEHPARKRIFWLLPLQLLWVNMHVFFSIGIMLVAGFLLEKIILNFKTKKWKRDPLVKKMAFLLLMLVIVSFINPRSAAGVFYRYESNFPLLISENLSITQFLKNETLWEDVSVGLFKPLAFLLGLSFIFGFRKKQKPIFYFLASAATAALAFVILRGLSFFGIVFLPAITANLNESFVGWRERLQLQAPIMRRTVGKALTGSFIVILCLLIFPGWPALSRYKHRGLGLAKWSEDSERFFKEQGLKGPILNDADIGSYLIYYLYPQEKVFADNRFADAYSAAFFRDLSFPMLGNEDKWHEVLQLYNFNVIFFYHYDAAPNSRQFLWRRMQDPAWALVHADPFAVILVRNTEANKAVIEKFHITKDNVAEKLSYLTSSQSPDDKVAAADLLNLIGREDLAREEFLRIVIKSPQRGKIWMVMGEMALGLDNETSTVLGMMFLEKAISVGHKTAEVYSYLGAAYARMRQPEKAKAALRAALKINPDRDDARILLEKIEKDTGK